MILISEDIENVAQEIVSHDEVVVNNELSTVDVDTQIDEVENVETSTTEEIDLEINEAIGWSAGDHFWHQNLIGVDFPDQHPIGAITDLQEEFLKKVEEAYGYFAK